MASRARTSSHVALALAMVGNAGLAALWVAPAMGATSHSFTVDTTNDTVDVAPGDHFCADGNGDCSLRAAVMETNAHGAGSNVITLKAGVYTLTRSTGDDAAAHGDLDILGNLTIQGAGPDQTIIDGFANDRIFDVAPDGSATTLTLEKLTVHNGRAVGNGGGIRVTGPGALDPSQVAVTGNSATGNGGGIWSGAGTVAVTWTRLNIAENHADGDGGGLYTEMANGSLELSSITDNTAGGSGGGLRTARAVAGRSIALDDVTIARNRAGVDGGGWSMSDAETPAFDHENLTIAENRSSRGGGLFLDASDDVLISGLTLVGNRATISGAGIYGTGVSTPLIDDAVIHGNVGPGNECGGTHVASTLWDSVVDECVFATMDPTVLTGETGGLGPLEPVAQDRREVMVPQPGWVGIDFNNTCGSGFNDQVQPPFTATEPCDAGAWEAPIFLVVDVLDDSIPFDETTVPDEDDRTTAEVASCVDGQSPCNLRGALEVVEILSNDINSNDVAMTIQLGPGVHSLTNGHLRLDADPGAVNRRVTITGAGADLTTIDGLGTDRLFDISATSVFTISDLTLQNGSVVGDGGAIRYSPSDASYSELHLTRTTLANNAASGSGGAVFVGAVSPGDGNVLTDFIDVAFEGNTADLGGAVYVDDSSDEVVVQDSRFSENGFAVGALSRTSQGGALLCDQCELIIDRSLFVDNVAADQGGALYLFDVGGSSNQALVNSTFVRNHAGPGDPGSLDPVAGVKGGAMAFADGEFWPIVYNTWVDNTSQGVGGAIGALSPGNIINMDFDGNAMVGNRAASGGDHCLAIFDTGTDNAADTTIDTGECSQSGGGDIFPIQDQPLLLGALTDNGGAQDTMMPQLASPLRNASVRCPTSGSLINERDALDARGGVRDQVDGACDIGATELPQIHASLEAEVRWARSPAIVPLRNLPDEAVAQAVKAARDAAEGGTASTPMSAIDINASPMSAIPMSAIPMSAIVLADLPFASDALRTLLLVDIPVVGGWDAVLAGSSLQNVPLQILTLGDVLDNATARAKFNALDLGEVGISSTPMSAIPMSAIAMGALPMSAIPLNPGDAGNPVAVLAEWCTQLDALGFPCADLGIVPATPSTASNWSIAALALAGVPMSAIPMSAIPMSAIDIGATPMSAIPMSAIDIGATPMSAIPMSAIDIAGTPMSAIPMSAIPMSAIPMSAIPMSAIPMSAINIAGTPMSAIPMSAIPAGSLADVVDCGLVDCATATLGDAFDAGAILLDATIGDLGPALAGIRLSDVIAAMSAESLAAAQAARNDPESRLGDLAPFDDLTLGELFAFGEMTLGQLIEVLEAAGMFAPGGPLEGMTLDDLFGGLLPFTDYPWENIDLDAFNAQLYADDATPIPYTLNIAAVDPLPGYEVNVVVDLPDGFVYIPGSTDSPDGFGEPTVTPVGSHQRLRWELADVQQNVVPIRMVFEAFPSLASSANEATITASLPTYGTSVTKMATVFVFESLEPNDTVALSTLAEPDTLYITQVSHPSDIDVYQVDVEAGERLSILLSDLPADYDLVLFSPDTEPDPLRDGEQRRLLPMDDEGLNLLRPVPLEPQPLDDINLGSRFIDGTGLDVYGTSARRGLEDERIETPPLPRAGTYRIQVSGYDGAFSPDSYTLRMTVRPGPNLPACDPLVMPFDGEGVLPGAPPAVPADTDTVFLVNESRLGDAFGDDAVNAAGGLLSKLDDFVTAALGDGVKVLVYPVDSDAQVRTAYAAWDTDTTCHPDTANDVVREIGRLVGDIRTAAPDLQHVVLIGGDEQIPFGRVPDRTSLANETSYAATFTGNNPLSGSLARGFLLSDEPYGDANPLALGSRDFFVTDLALGRLVETPAQIEQALTNFLATDGVLDAASGSSAFVGGYDFLTDGAEEITDKLEQPPHNPAPGIARTVDPLINETWTRAQLVARLFDGDNDIASVNAHFDHFRSLPALGNATHNESDLFEIDDLQLAAGATLGDTILFSMGCHSGLSVSDVQIVAPGDIDADWAQNFAETGTAAYAANSGFGYGDTEVVALSEELMSSFAEYLDGTASIGQAFMYAKQRYAADLGANGAYDEKVLMEATFYGLPMYRITDIPVSPPAVDLEPEPGSQTVEFADDAGPLGADPDGEPDLVRVDAQSSAIGAISLQAGPRGSWFSFDGPVSPQEQVTHFRPIQPIGTYDFTFMDPVTKRLSLDLRGVKIKAMETTAILNNFNPVLSRPILASADNETEPRVGDVVFPSTPANVTRLLTPSGERTQLNVTYAQFRGQSDGSLGAPVLGQQKRLDDFEFDLFFGAVDGGDKLPPRLDRVDAYEMPGDMIEFRIEVTDDSDILEGNVLFIETNTSGPWTPVALNVNPVALPSGRILLTGTAADPSPGATGSIEYLVQVVDVGGNVGVSTNKGIFHFEELDAPDLTPPTSYPFFLFNDRAASSRWFNGDVNVKLEGFPGGTTLSVDGGPFVAVPGTGMVVTSEGSHNLVARPGDGSSDIPTLLRIDRTDPTVEVVDPVDGIEVFQSFPPDASAFCTDALSGIRSCEVDDIDTSVLGGPFNLTATATDRAGNTGSVTTTYTVIEDDPDLFDAPPILPSDPSPTPTPTPDPDPDVDPTPDNGDEVTWPGEGLQWLFGENRYETAARLAMARYPDGADTVFIGTGTNFPDLVALGSLTQTVDGPILLVTPTSIPRSTHEALLFLRPKRIVVVGGPRAVSQEVFDELRSLLPDGGAATFRHLTVEPPPIERLAGPDRYATAAAIARRAFPDGAGTVVLVTGENFPDAMTAGPLAARLQAPVLLTTSTGLPEPTRDVLESLNPTRLIIIGGPRAISPETVELARLVARDCEPQSCRSIHTERIHGVDRHETAAKVATKFTATGGTVYVVSGSAWPDGLGVVPLAQRDGVPILLVRVDGIPGPTKEALQRLAPRTIAIIGGPRVVGTEVAAQLRGLLPPVR